MVQPDPNAEAAAAAGHGVTNPALLKILADAGAAGAQKPQDQAPVVDQNLTPKEVELELAGVKKRVPVEELARMYSERDRIAVAKQALEESMRERGDLESVRGLRDQLAGLSGARRQKVLELLSSRDEPDAGDDAGDVLDDAFGNAPRSRAHAANGAPQGMSEQDRSLLYALASAEKARMNVKHEETTSDRVEKAMAQFPVFADEKDEGVRHFAKRSIMTEVLNADGASIEEVVLQAASALQKIKQKAEASALEGVVVPRRNGVLKKGLTGADLRNGVAREIASQLLRAAR